MLSPKGKTNPEIVGILEICRDIEHTVGQLYFYYAELYKDDIEYARLWAKTAMEEEEHEKQFIMAINLRNQWEIEDVSIDKIKAESVLKLVKAIYKAVHMHKPTLIDALSSAIELELSFADFHVSAMAKFSIESNRKFFANLISADRQHIVALQKAQKKLADESTDWIVRNE